MVQHGKMATNHGFEERRVPFRIERDQLRHVGQKVVAFLQGSELASQALRVAERAALDKTIAHLR